MNRRLLAVCAVTIVWLVGVSGVGHCDNERLAVVQDESSMERIVEHYLVDNHQLVVNEKTAENDAQDMYLELPFAAAGAVPAFRLAIDSQPLNTDPNTHQVIERGLLFNLYTGIVVPADKRAAALAVVNDWNKVKAFACVYIDTDGEVICSWIINVLADGLPTEYAYDAVARMDNIWKGLHPKLAAALE